MRKALERNTCARETMPAVWFIRKNVLEAILAASRNVFPREFIGLLGGNAKARQITEIVVLPADFGPDFSSIRLDLLPFDDSIVGSVHSHPSGSARPSRQDVSVFPKMGAVHLIVGISFQETVFKAWDARGKELIVQVIE